MTAFVPGGPPRFAHQRRGLAKMIATGGVTALLFDPGLGKTAVVLDYASLLALKSRTGEARVLVVCPLVAVDTWVLQSELFMSPQVHYWAEAVGGSIPQRGEVLAARGGQRYRSSVPDRESPRAYGHRWSLALGWRASERRDRPMTASEGPDGLGTDKPRVVLEIINIDTLVSRQPMPGHRSVLMSDHLVDAIRRFGADLVVVDESHKIKAAKGNASRLLARVQPYVRRRILLTGTVMPHSPLDVFGQWRFLEPTAFGKPANASGGPVRKTATYAEFRDRFAVYGGFMGHEVTGYLNLDDMQKIMAINAAVARKADALDLPPTTDVVIPVDLSKAETKAYAEMKSSLSTQLISGTTATVPNRLAQMMRLRQITSGHLPDDLGRTHVIGTSKAQVIKSIVNDTLAGEKRVVIFCLFSTEIEMLCRLLAEPGTEIMRIEGNTPTSERMTFRARFGDLAGCPDRIVLVCQIKTMSLAVNELVTASHAVFGSLSQQRDDYVQARDRLNRIGQRYPVTFWHALAPGTVDEVILRVHREREDLESAMLKHITGEEIGNDGRGHHQTSDRTATGGGAA